MRIAIPSNVGMRDARSSKQMWKPAATVGGHWELGAAALLKAVRWDFRLADGLVFFVSHSRSNF